MKIPTFGYRLLRRTQLRRRTPIRKRRPGPARDIEAAHVGARGYGARCHDREAIALCGIRHHREGPESHHRLGRKFWAHHRLDKSETIRHLNDEFEAGGER